MNWKDFNELLQPLYPMLATVLVSVIAMLLRRVQRWVDGKISSDLHKKKSGIVFDSMIAAFQKLGKSAALMLADGKLSAAEKAQLKDEARVIAKARLAELRGVVLEEATEWVEHELDVALGKLEALILGTTRQGDGQTIGPDDPAVAG